MELYYEESGNKSAPLLMFIHGGGVSSWMWDKQIEYFQNYHCIVPILPEHGLQHNETKFSITNSAEQLVELIKQKANEKTVAVVGFSLGAQVLIKMLSIQANLIDFAMINSALVTPPHYAHKWIRPAITLSFPLIKYKWFSRLQAKTLYIDDDHFEKYYKESSHMKRDTLIKIMDENMTFTIPNDFSNAKGDILVTVGAKERKMMKKSAKEIVSSNENCTAVTIRNIGHGASIAMPDIFNRFVETWLTTGKLPSECDHISIMEQ